MTEGCGAQGLDEGLAEAFVRLRQRLRSHLRRRLSDPSQADDLLHDVFAKALATRRAGRTIGNLSAWLHTATRNALADHYRSAGRTEPLVEDVAADDPDDTVAHQELAACVRPFVDRLPPIYRDTIVATELQGETLVSLARREGVTVSAMKSRAARARAMLRESFLACCDVEMSGELVGEYRRKSPSGCEPACG